MSGRMSEFFGLRVYPLESDIGISMRRERIFPRGLLSEAEYQLWK